MLDKDKFKLLHEKRRDYYIYTYIDDDDIDEALLYAKFVKKFFIKLDKNKDININLLINHLILLFNCFDKKYIIKYLFYYVNEEHLKYLKTILLYMKKIELNDSTFNNIAFSYDFDYLLRTINGRKF